MNSPQPVDEVWRPNATVAAAIERDGRFLLVEEETSSGLMFNQPAGHLENGESLVDAVIRETLEETGWRFEPAALVGIYQWRHPRLDTTFLRFTFCGQALAHDPGRALDTGIVRAAWFTPHEIRSSACRHRSPLVVRSLDDYLAGRRFPLDLIRHFP